MLLPNLKCFALALLIGLLPGFRVYSQDFREQTVLNNYADNSDSLSSEYFQSNSQVQWHSIFTNIPKDFYLFGTTGVTGDNLKTLLGVGVTTGALFIFDDDLHQATKKILGSSPFLKKVSNVTVYLGDGKTSLALALGLSSYGLIAGDSKFTKTSVKIVESMLVSGIFVQFLKRITGRESPAAATTKCGMWRLFPSVKKYQGNQKKYYSFPSGHITTITSTMTVLNNCYPDSKFLKPLSYGLITLTGFSLIKKDMHWFSDFPLGLFIGYTFGNIISPDKTINFISKKADFRFTTINTPGDNSGVAPSIQFNWNF